MRIVGCPICHKKMDIVHIGRVEIDKCERCEGVWLDKDELTELLDQERGRIAEALKKGKKDISDILDRSLGTIFSK